MAMPEDSSSEDVPLAKRSGKRSRGSARGTSITYREVSDVDDTNGAGEDESDTSQQKPKAKQPPRAGASASGSH